MQGYDVALRIQALSSNDFQGHSRPCQARAHRAAVRAMRPQLVVLEATTLSCAGLPTQARPTMAKSVVLDSLTGESQDSEVRTSTGTFFDLNVRPCCLLLPSLHKVC